ncbi:hypothetical protein CORC01_04016 [Colletotrichum orchidophilum]|uniref:LPXTG-domain-containing protein n=1 Tax=Colletotrichum orchidophilum TaxID=1209926 RepID=A0A1G4BH26_9PEZI|nr:uncharacterized protein CORC01_04016 [Colletotrichum orchidophilum]OHF00699.1 hypothetical protein CORC01_04016 [Colletotrichum orchidophilum]
MNSDTSRWQFSLRAIVAAASIAVHKSIAQECAYEGGWALRNDRSCPPSAPVECGTGAQPRCCPSGFKCTGDGDYVGNYCCEDPADCRALSLEYPKCPDSSWTLWGVEGKLDNGGWCCQSGQNGTYRDNSNGIALLCTPTTVTSLASTIFWAEPVSTSSCSTTSTTSTAATISATATAASTTATTNTGASATAESTGAATASGTSESSSLSTGAIAGAVIGGVAGGALLAAGIFFLWRRKKSNAAGAKAESTPALGEGSSAWAYERKDGQGYGGNGGGMSELAVPEPRAEMDSATQPTYELDAAASNTAELDAAHSGARPTRRDDLKYR